ncbi:hypothetical protein [Parasediminibacterium sp. JCM 36343]|uniref:gliding motility lipoprotein GldB n=1 Tax=Parasediminibacterium sp. JCM 36343 TaxID=3374279 RepID=UPI00397D7152
MIKIAGWLLLAIVLMGCSHKKNIPDVSQVEVSLKTIRFEKDFFSLDTTRMDVGLQALFSKYQGFSQDFFFNILGIAPQPDSIPANAKLFLNTYLPIYKASVQPYTSFSLQEAEIKKGLQFVHYYFPKYALPNKLVTFIGPFNSYAGIIMPNNTIAIGLQLYLGKDFPVYQSDEVQAMYPSYVSRRFDAAYIPVNSMKNIVDDLFASLAPTKKEGQLIDQMIEEGKRLYVLDAFLPYTPDSLKTGYTQKQLDFAFANEKEIWAFIIESNLLYQSEPSLVSPFVNDGPNTAELGEASPGNIGQFVGWQIVKKWMEKNDKATLQQLIQTPAKKIFEEAKYKPR